MLRRGAHLEGGAEPECARSVPGGGTSACWHDRRVDRRRPAAGLRPTGLALVLLLSSAPACSDGGGTAATTEADRTPSGSAEADEGQAEEATSGTLQLEPSTTTTTTPEDRALSELLPSESPLPGFERADDVLGAGPLDLDAAAAAESDADAERALLEGRGFERGASRAWIDPEAEDVVYLAIYDFASAEGATTYLADGGEALETRGATAFEVPEVEGARGFTTIEGSSEGTFVAHAVAFTRGERWVLALVGSPGSGRSPDDARAVAAAQADLLG